MLFLLTSKRLYILTIRENLHLYKRNIYQNLDSSMLRGDPDVKILAKNIEK